MHDSESTPIFFRADRDAAFAQSDALIAERIRAQYTRLGRTILVGLSGTQASGKSHTAARLARWLGRERVRMAVRSLDDFYLTRAERKHLAMSVHPLLETRGVPGTHDISLMHKTFDRLGDADDDTHTPLPTFDKTSDDRASHKHWPIYHGRPDVILLEGWCVGARPQPVELLAEPINALERDEDPDGRWRTFVNEHLAADYAALFARLDLTIMLKAPSFECVLGWRTEQEEKLERPADGSRPPMSAMKLRRFIDHYERLTRWQIEHPRADIVVAIGEDRKPLSWSA
jgi:D-glycerate 3-kinase